jgi:hypothetical protein
MTIKWLLDVPSSAARFLSRGVSYIKYRAVANIPSPFALFTVPAAEGMYTWSLEKNIY